MHTIRVQTLIGARPAVVFDLARSVDAHVISAAGTGERVVGGRMSGLLELGEQVTFQARHFGFVQRLTSRITAMDRPRYFQDRMVAGAFRSFEHDHIFEPGTAGGTVMVDVLRFAAPLRPVGWVIERLILGPHLRRFLVWRGLVLKRIAEQSANGSND